MSWYRVVLNDEELKSVRDVIDGDSPTHLRRKMLLLLSLHLGHSRREAADLAGVSLATAQRYVAAFRDGGLENPESSM